MKSILYIEDNQDTAEAVKIILDNAGYQTTIINSGEKGIKIIKKQFFDLILLDIMLPDMSGWDIFARLNNLQIKCKCVFLSAIPISTERLIELKKAGISDYITKPFAKIDLIEKVNEILKG